MQLFLFVSASVIVKLRRQCADRRHETAIQDVRPIYLRGILDAAIKVAAMSVRSAQRVND